MHSENSNRKKQQDQTAGYSGNEQDLTSGRQQERSDSDAEARRDPNQAHNYKGEADNVNDDSGRPLNETDADKARNKATEGLRQQRDED